jgi:carboxypeptidase C (cathepsin A)
MIRSLPPALLHAALGLTLSLSLPLSAQESKAAPHAAEKKPDPKADEKHTEKEKEKEKEKPADDKPKPDTTKTTDHTVTLNGQKIAYTATAGTLALKDAEGKNTAEIFYIAYTQKNPDPATALKRPLTFSFNGGPGSSSVWLHMGLLGPKRVKLQDNGFAVPPPYELVENESCLLDETDLVFIDPVGTGYSRATKPEDAKNFHGLAEDTRSVAEFIRLYVTKNARWPSPKFLIGESYGTTRAAALSGELLKTHRMNLNGLMLVSTVLNFQTIWGGEGNDLPHLLYLPSYAATAWYHHKLPADLQNKPVEDVLKEAETFATGDYNQALLLGSGLPPAQRAKVVKQFARLTGLSEAFIEASNLRVPLFRFNAELLRGEKKVIGRFDSRYTSLVQDPLSEGAERDPSADAIFSAYASTFNHYVRTDLQFEDDRPYHILAGLGKWNWGADNEFVNVAETLADSITANPFLKVHVSNGIYDLATPYFAARYTFNHMRLHPELQKNIVQDDYTAGHMMYLNLPDLRKQKADLAKFIRQASGK